MNYSRIILGLSLLFSVGISHALTVVHMETQLDVTTSDVYFELYDEVALNNVNNFVGYVTRGDFDNSFFHRKAQYFGSSQYPDGSPFVVQGGGFTYVPKIDFDARTWAFTGLTDLMTIFDPITGELGLRPIGEQYMIDLNNDDIPDEDPPGSGNIIYRVNDGLKRIPVDTSVQPVVSEASLSNLRGTIAMALTSAGPDSASSQWFINLNDNLQLDPGKGNFTVFGRVLGAGISFFDTVNDLGTIPIASNINTEFGEIPVINYEAFTLMLGENLVRLNSASEVLKIDISDYNFDFVDIGQTAQKVITLTVSPNWPSALVMGNVGDLQLLDLPFSATNTCDLATIQPGGSCTITVSFDPTSPDNYQDILDIAFAGPSIPNLSIDIAGRSRTLPKVASSTGNSLDFQYVFPGIPETQIVSISNLGQQPLTFDTIAIDNVANFTASDTCVGATLLYGESCDIEVIFSTPDEGLKSANLAITSNASGLPFEISLLGTGSSTIIPDIDAETVHDFGDLLSGTETSAEVTLTNRGTLDLEVLSKLNMGGDINDFTSSGDCVQILAPGESCVFTVVFAPSIAGSKATTLRISSDDPNDPEFDISLLGTSSNDSDNVPDVEEDAAPNNGDGNSDSVPDKFQSYAVSMLTASGEYLTLTASNFFKFRDTAIVGNPTPGDIPNGAKFDHGMVSYSVDLAIPTTSSIKIGMILPAGQRIDKFYQYGPTPDNIEPHWYEFMFDGVSGANIFNNVTMTAPNGSTVQRNIVELWYADGQRGDDDLTVNGTITSTSGVSISQASDDAPSSPLSGSFNGYLAIMIFVSLLTLRCFPPYYLRYKDK